LIGLETEAIGDLDLGDNEAPDALLVLDSSSVDEEQVA
jgi:hypothetical protein